MASLVRLAHVPVRSGPAVPPTGPADDAVGVAEHPVGSWTVTGRRCVETVYVLAGDALLTDADTGYEHRIGEGDLITLPAGWSGRWIVRAPLRAIHVRS